MATLAFKNATVSVDDTGGTLRDISAHVSDAELSFSVEAAEDSALGDSFRTRVATLSDVSVSISGQYDTTASTGSDTVLGGLAVDTTQAAGTVTITDDGSTTTYSGEAIMTSYSITGSVDGIISYSAEFVGSGAWTRS